MKAKLLKVIVASAIVLSLLLNAYQLGYVKWKQAVQVEATGRLVGVIADQAIRTGQVILNLPDRTITLKLDKPRKEGGENASEAIQ